MFERFTDQARKALIVAQDEARTLVHPAIANEHIFLGLLAVKPSASESILTELGVDIADARDFFAKELPPKDMPGGHIPFTTPAKKILEGALRTALRLGHDHIGTNHLLIGLCSVESSLVKKFLENSGISIDNISELASNHLDNGDSVMANNPGNSFKSDRFERGEKSSALDQFGKNLTAAALAGNLDPVIGRDTETERLLQVLLRRTKNNPVLIGEPGVGKSAVVEGLAQRIARGEVPAMLANKKIYTIDLALMVAGARYRGDFEERMKKVLAEISRNKDVIIFIDEIHTILGAGAAEGSLDAANLLKPILARGEIQVIGATTLTEYRKIEKDAALERRFQPVKVEEPDDAQTVSILKGLSAKYAEHHGVSFTDEALEAAVKLSSRYITDRKQPDKAIDVIDEAGAKIQISNDPDKSRVVDFELVSSVISMWTGIPINSTSDEISRLLSLESSLSKRVIGQADPVSAIAKAVRRNRSGVSDPKRPNGSFIFAGPTGVGKTELAKALAFELFGTEDSLIAIDMSEYSEKHTVSRMFGSPPGYVGYDEGGQLTEQVRRKPYSVVLFDEIEKAHPDVFNSLLQVLEEGRLSDSSGKVVNFSNTIIIMTTNLGSRAIVNGNSLGFAKGGTEDDFSKMKSAVQTELKSFFRPEFLNRVDDVIVFHALEKEAVGTILDKFILEIDARLASKDITLMLTADARSYLIDKGYDTAYGARPLRRVVQREIEDIISEKILLGEIIPSSIVVVEKSLDSLEFTHSSKLIPDVLDFPS